VFGDRFIGTSLEVGGLVISGNTVTSLNTNSNIVLDPQGSARVQVNGPMTVTGTMQVSSSQTIDMGSNRIQSVATPSATTDATNKSYVDSSITTAINNSNFILTDDSSTATTINNGEVLSVLGSGLVTTSISSNDHLTITVATQTLETVTNAGATTINSITVGSVDVDGLQLVDNNIKSTRSNDDINLIPAGTGKVVVSASTLQLENSRTIASSIGSAGDELGDIAIDATYIYYCTANYDGATNIWKRTAHGAGTW
jgi:hypothetical protein